MNLYCKECVLSLQPPAKFLLPEVSIADYGKNCVVIDLDETLVHSSFKVFCLTHHVFKKNLCFLSCVMLLFQSFKGMIRSEIEITPEDAILCCEYG